ncbi:hypothetical protein EV363DRAFT_1495117 [Boletus edulis]|nr:hypothetical protein EV363DRAFT_1495117 [Boletus edulis]
MSSDVRSSLQFLVLNNYITVAGLTVVVYDYALTFSRELDYVWCQSWTWVSTMFVVVRYIGLYWSYFADGSSFVPGPVEVSKVMYLSYGWAFVIFMSITDLLMILRVYAMCNRSRTVRFVLLSIYVIQSITTVTFYGIIENPNASVRVIQVLDFSFCSGSFSYSNTSLRLFGVYFVVPRLALSATLTILAVFQTLKQSFEMYKATRQWRPNRYMQKLVKEGILYFIVNVLYQADDLLNAFGYQSTIYFLFLEAFVCISFYVLIPRFVISIRELYDHDIRGRFHIDTGFGVQSRSNDGLDTTVSAMVFVDVNQGPEVEGSTDNSEDVGVGRVHGSNLNEVSLIGARV